MKDILDKILYISTTQMRNWTMVSLIKFPKL